MQLGLSPFKKSSIGHAGSGRLIRLMGTIPALVLEARRSEGPRKAEILEAPTVGAVICAYNEERNIGPLLGALIREHIHEIVVVASGCTDRTVEIANHYRSLHGNLKILVEEARNGKASAVNLALKAVTSKFVVFLPADVRPAKGSIARLIGGFRPEVGIRVGRPMPVDEKSNTMGRLSHLIWTLHNRTLMELSADGSLGHATGEFFAIRRGIVNQLPIDVVNDDAYMAIAVQRAGYKINYDDEAVAFMRGPGTVSDYVSQRRRVQFGHIQVMKSTGRYPTVFETQALIRPSLFFRMLQEELKGIRGGLRALIMGSTLETISLALSTVDRLLGRSHVLWKMVESTKSLSGASPLPSGMGGSVGALGFSRPDAYPGQSLDRNWRSGSARGQLSPLSAVAALRPYMCY